MDFAREIFVCEICHGEVIENENAESVRGSQDRMQRFNRAMRFIIEGLRKTESMVLPASVTFVSSEIELTMLTDWTYHHGSKTMLGTQRSKRRASPQV